MAGRCMQLLDEDGIACVPGAQHDTEFPLEYDDWSSEISTSLRQSLDHSVGTWRLPTESAQPSLAATRRHGPLKFCSNIGANLRRSQMSKNVPSQQRKEVRRK